MARRVGERPLAVGAGVIVALEALLGSAGASAAAVAGSARARPGLALAPLLPARVKENSLSVLAAAPVLGIAAASVLLITLASAGISLDPTAIRLALASVVAVGLLLPWPEAARPPGRADWPAAAGLALRWPLGAVLQQRVIGGEPIPGNDWAKYLLYGDEVAAHGELLITNPFWMLGVPFREDPGVPALLAPSLSLTGEPASTLSHGIWVFAIASILGVFAFARAFWGELAASSPPASGPCCRSRTTSSPGTGAEPRGDLPPHAGARLRRGPDRRRPWPGRAAGLGLLLVALAATHRLTALVGRWPSWWRSPGLRRRRARPPQAHAARRGIHLAGGPRVEPGGGLRPRRARAHVRRDAGLPRLSAKVNLGPVVGDLSVIFTVMAVAALVLAVRLAGRDRAVATLLSLLAVVIALAYAWIFEIPTAYFRMALLPLALVPLVALALVRLLDARRAAIAGAVASVAIAGFAWVQGANVRDFYAFTNTASLRGLDAVSADLRPDEVV